jgi:hypothetical protein
MRQLVDHFQQTSYTPRNFNALLPTPRPLSGSCRSPDHLQHFVSVNGSYAYGYDANTDTLTLCSPRGDNKSTVNSRALYSFDPKCFEEDHPSTQVTAKAEFRGTISNQRENNEDVWEYSECLDAPVNAAVNVALKCATREASFEEVLSWLGRAPDHFVNSSAKIDHPSATSSPIIDEVTLQETSFSSTSTHTTHSDVCSSSGMSLPSHLRPPLIVTAGIPEKGIGSLGSTPVPTPTPGTSDDHLFLVELLSNMKSSPKWGQQDTFVPVAPHVHIAPSPYDRKRLQQVQSGNGNYNVHFNGHGDEYGNGGGHGNLKSEDVGIAHNKDAGKRLKVEGQVESSTSWKRPNEEAATPTDRALKRVRAELTRRDRQKEEGMAQGRGLGTMSSDGHLNSQSGASDRQEQGQGQAQRRDVVPFQLLPFFEYLDDHAQR